MKKVAISALIAAVVLVGCESMKSKGNNIVTKLTQTDFLHRNWVLEKINGTPIVVMESFSAPNIEIGENFTVDGNNGCNRYFGQGELMGNKFRVDKMGHALTSCPPPASDLEMVVNEVLRDWSDVTLTKDRLVLSNDTYTLDFALRDWVQ